MFADRLYCVQRMKIVLVNWAMVWDGAVRGGGVNGYCQSLGLELAERGHEVAYVSGGMTYTPLRLAVPGAPPLGQEGPAIGRCEIRRHPDWLGIKVFEVVNSPVVAPSFNQFQDPEGEIASPELDEAFAGLMRMLRPDVVHFHNVEGFSAGTVKAARVTNSTGGPTRVYYSIHNYHTVCPQVYLMQGHRRPCRDFRNGNACTTCIETPPIEPEKQRRAAEFAGTLPPTNLRYSVPPPPPAPPAPVDRRPVLRAIKSEIRALLSPPPPPAVYVPPPPVDPGPTWYEPALPGAAIAGDASVATQLPVEGEDGRGQTSAILNERKVHRKLGPGDPEWEPLENTATPEPASPEPLNAYGRRRQAMIEMLNGCDGVLAVSDFVRTKFEVLGVQKDRIRTNHIGTRLNRVVKIHQDVMFDPPPFDPVCPRPVRMVFIGFNNWYKGLPMFADALEMLEADQLRRLHLYIYGLGVEMEEWRFRRMEPRLGGLMVYPRYSYYDVPWILGGKDIGIVPSVWWDNAPQTVFEMMSCGLPVLGANLGGIPDFVKDGHNGLLFRGNDRYDLARRIGEIVKDPGRLFELRRNVRAPKDIGDHAGEMEALYKGGFAGLDEFSAGRGT
jgi:glycosyltransferase involved in cell wall biosynthesis